MARMDFCRFLECTVHPCIVCGKQYNSSWCRNSWKPRFGDIRKLILHEKSQFVEERRQKFLGAVSSMRLPLCHANYSQWLIHQLVARLLYAEPNNPRGGCGRKGASWANPRVFYVVVHPVARVADIAPVGCRRQQSVFLCVFFAFYCLF